MTPFRDFQMEFLSTHNISQGEILPYELIHPIWAKCVSAEAEAWEKGFTTAIRTVVCILREQSAEAIAAKVDFCPAAWGSLANRLEKMK